MKSFLKFLSQNKLYTVIEAVGLVVSIAFVILIGNYVWQQYSIAYENPAGDRIYGIGNGDYVGLSWWDKYELESKIPEVEAACRIGGIADVSVKTGEDAVLCEVAYVDVGFFGLFPQYGLNEGNIEEFALSGRCMVSRSFADTNFAGNAIGRKISVESYIETNEYEICGVYPDFDHTMMRSCDILLNAEYDPFCKLSAPFNSIGGYITLIKVREGVDRATVAQKVYDVCRPNYDAWIPDFPIYTLPEIYFHNRQYFFRRGDKRMLGMLTVVVLLLLVSAVFNYENLNLALSGRRAKEMATRRLLGASKRSVICRFIAESVAFTAVCFGLAVLLAYALLPFVDRLLSGVSVADTYEASQYLSMRIEWSAAVVAAYTATVMLLGTVAGIAPALFASRFQPIDIVRGTFRRQTKMKFAKFFILFQNAISVVLIALALVMEVQMHHMMTRPLHARTENVFLIRFFSRNYEEAAPLADRLERIPGVGRTGYGTGYAGMINMGTYLNNPNGTRAGSQLIIADETYFDIMSPEIIEDRRAPASNTVWMSESLAGELALTDSVEMYYGSRVQINGVCSEHFGGIYADIPTAEASTDEIITNSVILVSRRDDICYGQGLLVEVTGDRKETAAAIREAYAEYSKERNGIMSHPNHIGFIDDIMSSSLTQVRTAMRLVELFMLLSVMLSLLGLVAMSTYFSSENIKSIAIRKVFGSNVQREILRTVSGYMVMVAVAAAIGIPVAVYLAGEYLSRFAYRITGYGWVFAAAAALSTAIAFLSVFWQVFRAARTNPAAELKKE